MNRLFIASFFAVSATAFASPFDAFVGSYTTSSKPSVESENAKFCNRFGFREITGMSIEKNDGKTGHKQSHTVLVTTPSSTSRHPIEDYDYSSDWNLGGSSAGTSGSAAMAANLRRSWNNRREEESFRVSIEKTSSGYLFRMAEEFHTEGQLESACYYQVALKN
ncbi:MAG TPA: hypothetical protein VM901_08355 [Bdellovibrionota bacterium]|nr:hypothetical protein [Bdellovibrionota bacterium]